MYRRIKCYNTFAKQVLHDLMNILKMPYPSNVMWGGKYLFYFTEEGWKEYGSVIWMALEDLAPKAEAELIEVPFYFQRFDEVDYFQAISDNPHHKHEVDNDDYVAAWGNATISWLDYVGRAEEYIMNLFKDVHQEEN